MEITKLRSQLSLAFEQLAAHLEAAWDRLARVGRGTADKRQEARCASENNLRRLHGSFLEAIAVTKPKIAKFRSQLSLAFEQLAAHLEAAWNTLARAGRSTAEKLEGARRASENGLDRLHGSFLEAIAVTKPKITEFRSQLSLAFEQLAAHLEVAWNRLARVGRGTADKLQEARRGSENDLRRLQASFVEAIVVTKPKITRFRSQLSLAFEQLAAHLEAAWNRLARVGRGTANKLEEARRASEDDLDRLRASFIEAIAATTGTIRKLGLQLSRAFEQVAAHFQAAWSALARFGRSVVDKPQRLREARRARENDLQMLLASSSDAVIVTDNDRRLVAANSRALDLFGVSESNIGKFTIDTFLSHGQVLDFDRNRSAFVRQEESHGKCKIRRLDGALRVVECIFVANAVPRRHLYRFRNVAPQRVNQSSLPASYTQDQRAFDALQHRAGRRP
jgi:PAS domain-containing protein